MNYHRVSKSKTKKKKSSPIQTIKRKKTKINESTLHLKWKRFIGDNTPQIIDEMGWYEPEEQYSEAWNFATDLFLDELSKEYDSEMLKRRFEEIIFDSTSFSDELYQLLDIHVIR